MRTRLTLLACAIAIVLIPATFSRSDATEQPERRSEIQKSDMQKKLDYSKNILDGLVTEDFDKIIANAQSLNTLGKRKWMQNDSIAYRTQNQVFWFTTGTLITAGEQKNLDGAMLSYTQMMHACVNCHQLIRRQ
ncbi:putative secreted protein [Rhodopirellula maiorica SM1]|uniref:Putative secreted protein n=1 Tax=Rhodopirellula maiorica SM1 TaxID=1265738 RepID=M5RQ95_9BACT|nr:hypothetical protein [Rhodopirellula maiorica]EMI21465.1 putative secreted protein [Rhodopirellula maiorica SM1]